MLDRVANAVCGHDDAKCVVCDRCESCCKPFGVQRVGADDTYIGWCATNGWTDEQMPAFVYLCTADTLAGGHYNERPPGTYGYLLGGRAYMWGQRYGIDLYELGAQELFSRSYRDLDPFEQHDVRWMRLELFGPVT